MNSYSRPRVAFLIPFASRRTKSRWDIACADLRQTLKSVHNSTSESYCVVVAGHEPPDFNIETKGKACFLSVDHDIPRHQNAVVSGRLDKLAKIAAAWNYAKSTWNPHYLMKLDADDLNLDRVCASCLIIRSDVADQKGPFLTEVEGIQLNEASLNFAASDHYSLVPGSGTSTLLLNDSHQRYAAQFAYLGHKLSTLPFRAVIYRIGNPDSNSAALETGRPSLRMVLGTIRRTKLMTTTLKREFALK